MQNFQLLSTFQPTGDQPSAIAALSKGVTAGMTHQTLLGVTGSGKTFTMANVIANTQRPTLVLAHNKTLAAQLASEFRAFFPHNAVHYFVSYYDYYQPEAYVPRTDTYIEKETNINEEIDRLRHASLHALLTRRDVIVVASVSCIYGIGSRATYEAALVHLHVGQEVKRQTLQRQLVQLQYQRNDAAPTRGNFRVQGDTVDVFPPYGEHCLRIQFFGDRIENMRELHPLTYQPLPESDVERSGTVALFPARMYVASTVDRKGILEQIHHDLQARLKALKKENKLVEAQRLEQRVNFDLEMLESTGYTTGIENYSRYFDRRQPGKPPETLVDYFPKNFLLFVDESHMTLPQIRGMYNGDRARKQTLVDFGFRLPAAVDNRPLKYEEFLARVHQTVFVSATPKPYELELSKQHGQITEQLIRPTGLLDPTIEIRPTIKQVDHLLAAIRERTAAGERVLITTLTKKMSEELAEYLAELKIKVHYLHSDVDTMERLEILRDLRAGVVDVVVGINLLREGLDLPEVSLVAILDADKESFLRDEISLLQIMGRAARHEHGHVIMYADRVSGSMQAALQETKRRRKIQKAYNRTHGLTPHSIHKAITEERLGGKRADTTLDWVTKVPPAETARAIKDLRDQMEIAAKNLEFEKAAALRDAIGALRKRQK